MSLSQRQELKRQIEERWNSLTKPPGSLGRLEEMVLRYGLIRGAVLPALESKAIYIFCGDHGITEAGVSAYPQEVTQQMVRNFLRGGAAISVLCRRLGIEPIVVDAGVNGPVEDGVLDRKIGPGTRNFLKEPAMTREQAAQAIEIGKELAHGAAGRFDILGAGEMGIGNTTAAAALLSVFSGTDASQTAGRGAGVDDTGLNRKIEVVRAAIRLHRPNPADPLGVLAAVGGFEIGAIAGLVLGAAEARVPVVLDGFISCSAALIAKAMEPDSLEAVFFSHRSVERGHARMLEFLGVEPYLALDMRLGEGTGAALMIHLLETALQLYQEMATFQQARVSEAE